ncbi:hypothetical protein GSUET_26420 [Geobacter sulfurreducens subsp. ethanolicus]|nr:hypothetical protein GSUET_26420 [Geobacter sulfurreducens subsp. ethanolicus]
MLYNMSLYLHGPYILYALTFVAALTVISFVKEKRDERKRA